MTTNTETATSMALFIRGGAAAGRRDDLYELYLEHLAPRAAANPGQEIVVWCADTNDDNVFHLFEIYRDAGALEANAHTTWFADYMAAAMPMLAAEPTIAMATPRWSTGR